MWDRPPPATLVDHAAGHGVRDLFVSTPGELATSPELAWFRSVRSHASAEGIGVRALGAEVEWLDDHAAAEAWQRQVLATGLFDGVHVDVEPWRHPGWDRSPEGMLESWVDLLRRLTAGTDLPVEADVSFWLHEHCVSGRPADEAVVAAVDAVTVMSYRHRATGPDSLTDVATTVLASAGRVGRPVRLAVETRHLGDDPAAARQTFHGRSRRHLAAVLDGVDAALAGHPTYAGIAVHDHAGWSAMRG